jgi:hypothetical protein
MRKFNLRGISGGEYQFSECEYEGDWNAVGGIYAFARRTAAGMEAPLYIGKCCNFRERLDDHERWLAASRLGGNVVLAAVFLREDTRVAVERDLVLFYQPRLNTLLKAFPTDKGSFFKLGSSAVGYGTLAHRPSGLEPPTGDLFRLGAGLVAGKQFSQLAPRGTPQFPWMMHGAQGAGTAYGESAKRR